METIMKKLKQLLPSNNPKNFLQALAQCHIESYEDYFLFATPKRERDLAAAIEYLSSPETFSLADSHHWTLIAQTIDGDYLLANNEQTLVLPVSLYKTDCECFPYSIVDFFIQYDNQEITSTILATKNG